MKSITLYIQPGLLIVLLLSLCFSLQAQDKEGLQPSDPLYREIAHTIIETDCCPVKQVVAKILAIINENQL